MKRYLAAIIALFLIANLTGCEAVAKKFRRKKKTTVKAPRFYQLKKYEKKPSPELYKKHYSYWVSWQMEIETKLGQNHKKDMRCMEEIVGNLRDMQNILIPEKGDVLGSHVDKLDKIRSEVSSGELSVTNRDYVRRSLERESRFIKREFCYGKVKNYLKKSFEEEPAPSSKETGAQKDVPVGQEKGS